MFNLANSPAASNPFNSLELLQPINISGALGNNLGAKPQPYTSRDSSSSRIQNFGVEDSESLKYSQGQNLSQSGYNNFGNISSSSRSNLNNPTGYNSGSAQGPSSVHG